MVYVLNSITNTANSNGQIEDSVTPYTFIEFITKTNSNNNESEFLTNYKEYLKNWAKVKTKNSEIVDTKALIREQIINLLKTLTVSFANQEEQRFLSSLNWDFTNISSASEREKAKASIYSALPLFVSRIKEIALFYRDRRTEATFVISRNKTRGSKRSIEKIIFDKLLDFIFSKDPSKTSYVQNYLNITINNYIDVYSDYFDVDRETAESYNYNDIDPTIYFELETVLSDMLFDGYIFLREIPLIASLAVDLSQECVGDMLTLKNDLVQSNTLSLVTADEKIALRRRLYEKYIGTDFYYLYKDGDKIITDIFIKAENPTNNLLNQQTIDTPYAVSKQLKLLKDIGLFFKPDKMSLLRIDTTNFSYSIDNDKVEEGKLYIFPDPNIYGNVSFNKQAEYPLIIEYTLDSFIKPSIFGRAAGEPFVQSAAQALFAYYSREQDLSKLDKSKANASAFSDIFNKGFIAQTKIDLYGNRFALFKQSNKFKADWTYNANHPDLPAGETTIINFNTSDGPITHYYRCVDDYQTKIADESLVAKNGITKFTVPANEKNLTKEDIGEITGKIYVYNALTQKVLELKNAMSWLEKYSIDDNGNTTYLIDNIISFDIIENTLFLKAKMAGRIWYFFDNITFNTETNTFERSLPQKEPIISGGTPNSQFPSFDDRTFSDYNDEFYPVNMNIYNRVSEPIYIESQRKCYFVSMDLDEVTNDKNCTYPILSPKFYEIDITNLSVKKYSFYKTAGQNKQQIESFSIPDSLLDIATVLIYKVSKPSIAYSEDALSFMLVYSVYDISNCLYVFKHFIRLSESASGADGLIDTDFLDSTIYQPGNSGQFTLIRPDFSPTANSLFVTNNIIN